MFSLFSFFMNAQTENSVQILEGQPARGCGNFMVLRKVRFEEKNNTFIILDFNAANLKLSPKFKKFKISNAKNIKVKAEILNTEFEDNYCTDALSPNVEVLQSLTIENGTIYVRKIKDESMPGYQFRTPYRVEVILKNAWFLKDGKKYLIPEIKFKNVLVGYMMG